MSSARAILLLSVSAFCLLFAAQARAEKLSEESEVRLAIDKAEIANKTGHVDDALAQLQTVEKKYPNNADLRSEISELYLDAENRGLAFDEASQSDYALSREGLKHQEAALLSPDGTFISPGYNFRQTNEAYENIYKLKGQMALNEGLTFSANLQNDTITSRVPFARSNGSIQDFQGDRQIGIFQLDQMLVGGHEVGASLYAQQNKIGVGGQYQFWDPYGSSAVFLDYNKPEADYIEAAVEHGTKSGITLERGVVFNQNLKAKIDGKYLQYGIDGAEDAANAEGWDFLFEYAHPFVDLTSAIGEDDEHTSKEPFTLGAKYEVGAEYFSYIKPSVDVDGSAFHPLPAASYEVHTFSATAAQEIIKGLKVEILGGFGVNRILGNTGPVYEATVSYEVDKNLSAEFHATRDLLGGQNNGEREDNIGLDIKWAFSE